MRSNKIIRACTVSMSVDFFIGMIPELRERGYEVVTVSSDGPELERVRGAGGRTIVVEMERHISPVKDIKSLWEMIKVFRREKPRMVHSMTPKAGLICMIAARLARVPVRVHTFTGLIFPTATGLTKRILMATDWLTCTCATHIIPEGEGVKRDLLHNKITKKPLKVLGYGNCRGIDLNKFSLKNADILEAAKSSRKHGIFTFIFIGRIVRDKGINELTEAFARLYSELKHTRLILLGPAEDNLDPVSDKAKQIIASCEGIEAIGCQKDVRPWLAVSDAFVFPSYREGFPNVVIEAGAMGLPQIVTDINGANEIILEGKNGTIIPSKDSDALYKAMRRMAIDNEWRMSLAANARPMIASRYEQSFVRSCLYDFYRDILHK